MFPLIMIAISFVALMLLLPWTTIISLILMSAVSLFGVKLLVKALTKESIINPEDENLDPKD